MIDLRIKKEIFNAAYLPQLYNYDTRINVYYGGAGSGKSVFVFQKMILKALKFNNRRFLVVRKVQNTLRDSCFSLVKEILSEWHLYEECEINKTELTITLPNKSCFIFKGLEDEERIKSINDISDIVIEEATEIEPKQFTQLKLRLRSRQKYQQIHLMFNPISKVNWVYNKWFNEESETYSRKDTMVLKTTYEDNKFLPANFIEGLKDMERTEPAYYRIYALGEFANLDKRIYTNWHTERIDKDSILYTEDIHTGFLRVRKGCKCVFGLDFGFTNDETAFTCSIVDEPKRKIYVYDGFYEKGMLNEAIYEKICKMGHRKEIITADSASPKDITALKNMGLYRIRPAIKGQDSILHGINTLREYEIIVDESLTWIVDELQDYTWLKDKATGEYINKPNGRTKDHALDSLRYAVTTDLIEQGKELKTLPYSRLFNRYDEDYF